MDVAMHSSTSQRRGITSVENRNFVGEIIGGKGLRCPDIRQRQMRMIAQYFFLGHPAVKFPQNQFDRYTRPSNVRFSDHDSRRGFYAFVFHVRTITQSLIFRT